MTDCFYIELYRDNDRYEVTIEKPMNNENILAFRAHSPVTSRRRLAAFVGPTSPVNANKIYEHLKSPSRDQRSSPDHKRFLNIIRSDDYKGYERVAR